MAYVDYTYYVETYGGMSITAENALRALQNASDTVDILTYSRIGSRGFEALTEFQKGIVQQVVCMLADWEEQNADMLSSPYQNYSINGVSASFGSSATVKQINGVLVPTRIYMELVKTGLCYGGIV